MPRFRILIIGEGLERARDALDLAGIPSVGPAFAQFVGSTEGEAVSRQMLAVLDANTIDLAVARLRKILPAGNYTFEPYEGE